MPRTYATLSLKKEGAHVLVVTLNRPEVLNAISTQMGRDWLELFNGLAADPGELRCIVLTGAGERAFCAGADLKERDGMSVETWRTQHAQFEQAFVALMECPVPMIAAVNGHAYGGGLETALCCDFIYAAKGAKLALSELRLGIMPGGCGTQNLPRAVGVRRAKEIVLTGAPFSAEEALAWGLVNKVCPDDRLLDEVRAVALRIAANAPISVRQAKRALDKATELDRMSGYAFEIEAYNRTIVTEDRQEGIDAFNEKRKPNYKGR